MLAEFIVIPFLCVLLLNLPFRKLMNRLALGICMVLSFSQTLITTLAIFGLWNIRTIPVSSFFKFNLGADNLSLMLLFCNGLVVFIATLASRSFTSAGEQRFNFMSLLLIALAGLNGVALVRDIFTLYVFVEVVSVSSFILISFEKSAEGLEGAFKYIMLSALATVLMLISIALVMLVSGDTAFTAVKGAVASSGRQPLMMFALALFLCGFFIKGGVVPFHGWVADAYTSAPAGVSIFLAGVATKALGIFSIMRIGLSVFGFNSQTNAVFLFLGAISAVVGALSSLTQTDFKRMLAYSSISQVGYILLGLGCATPLGIAAAAFHFINHAVLKSLFFVNSAAIEKQAGTRDMGKLSGLSSAMPLTAFTATIASLSNAGIPPLAGFWSKLMIIAALWLSGHYNYAIIAALASIITLGYMLYMQRSLFFGRPNENLKEVEEAGFGLGLAATTLTLIIIGVGLLFPFGLWKLVIR